MTPRTPATTERMLTILPTKLFRLVPAELLSQFSPPAASQAPCWTAEAAELLELEPEPDDDEPDELPLDEDEELPEPEPLLPSSVAAWTTTGDTKLKHKAVSAAK